MSMAVCRSIILLAMLAWTSMEVVETSQEIHRHNASWIGSREGITDEVLPPWEPIQVKKEGGDVSVQPWGRSYEFTKLPFPSRIEAAGKSIVTSPIRLAVRADGREMSWKNGSVKVTEDIPARTKLSYSASDGPLSLAADIIVEYDGMIRIDWALRPERAVRLDKVTLEIPVRAEHARYLYNFPGEWASKNYNARALPREGHVGGFWPFIWLGDEERGLAWFCESNENWFTDDPQTVTEIGRVHHSDTPTTRHSEYVLRLHIISRPVDLAPEGTETAVKIKNELSYSFGLQATPVKPVLKDVWDYRIVHVDVQLSGPGMESNVTVPDKVLDRFAKAGVKTIAIHEHWTEIESYVTTKQDAELKKLVAACHSRGMDILLYFGFLISDLAPEFSEYVDECVVMPRTGYEPYDYPGQPKQNAYKVCYNSVWQDRLAVGIADVMDEYDADGVYLDGTQYPWPCANRRHGCGIVRPDGGVTPSYPIWAVRSMMKRIYTIVRARKPDGQVNVHNSTCMTIPTMSWSTGYWDGEQFRDLPLGFAAGVALPLDAFRAEFMGHQWGLPAEFLSYEKPLKGGMSGFMHKEANAFTLLHDVLSRTYSVGPALKLNSALWRISDEFGRKHAKWLPYWKNASFVSSKPDGVLVSLYQHPKNGVLAVVSNLGRDAATAAVQLNLKKLGISGNVSALDAITRKPISIRQGRFQLPLKSLDWRIIWAKSKR